MARVDQGGGTAGDETLSHGAPSGDTVVALSSGQPPAAIAIVRLSGPQAFASATSVAGRLPRPRHAALRAIRDGDLLLDRAVVLVFPGPRSATGEDLVELHCHGGRAVIAAVVGALARQPGVRAAEPGEFARRALIHGRIDLAQAQGLGDLLRAESEAERRLAVAAAEGALSRTIRDWIDRLTALAAEVEASIDFAEEGDVIAEAASLDTLATSCDAITAEMAALLSVPPVERWRDGWRIVLAGPPNAGKSTLANLLAGRDASIVTPIAGTTRDRIEVPVRRAGIGYLLIDTAGLRAAAADPVEAIGIARSRDAIGRADLLLWLGDEPPEGEGEAIWVHARADQPHRGAAPAGCDLAVAQNDPRSIDRLWALIVSRLGLDGKLPPFALHDDERRAIDRAHDALRGDLRDVVLLAEALRAARRSLAMVLGIDATQSLLDRIFGQFCIGK